MFLLVLANSCFLHIPWNDADAFQPFNLMPPSWTLKANIPYVPMLALSRLNDDTLSFQDN